MAPVEVSAATPDRPAASAGESEVAAPPRHDPQPEALHELSLLVPSKALEGSKRQDVQVRLVERAGEIHVAVRTQDPELTQSLRERLGDLVSRLEQNGYRTETWRPAEVFSGSDAGHQSFRQDTSRQSLQDFEGGRGGPTDQGNPQQRRSHRDQPAWVESLLGAGLKPAPTHLESIRSSLYELAG